MTAITPALIARLLELCVKGIPSWSDLKYKPGPEGQSDAELMFELKPALEGLCREYMRLKEKYEPECKHEWHDLYAHTSGPREGLSDGSRECCKCKATTGVNPPPKEHENG